MSCGTEPYVFPRKDAERGFRPPGCVLRSFSMSMLSDRQRISDKHIGRVHWSLADTPTCPSNETGCIGGFGPQAGRGHITDTARQRDRLGSGARSPRHIGAKTIDANPCRGKEMGSEVVACASVLICRHSGLQHTYLSPKNLRVGSRMI